MLPNPLHPVIVHFPVVLVFLVPISALAALWAIRRGARSMRAWAIPLALSAALALSAWVAVETGQAQEERVEDVVPDGALDSHEEAAEMFLVLSGVLVAVTAAGFLRGAAGRVARVAATAGAAGLIIAAVRVGDSGGKLVYRYGAANAYTTGSSVAERGSGAGGDEHGTMRRGGSEDDDDR